MSKRSNGEGTWSKVKIKENDYYLFRIYIDHKRKSFYGKTKKEALEKYRNASAAASAFSQSSRRQRYSCSYPGSTGIVPSIVNARLTICAACSFSFRIAARPGVRFLLRIDHTPAPLRKLTPSLKSAKTNPALRNFIDACAAET